MKDTLRLGLVDSCKLDSSHHPVGGATTFAAKYFAGWVQSLPGTAIFIFPKPESLQQDR